MKSWKKAEARIAELFGTIRNPMSGSLAFRVSDDRETKSDSKHNTVYIECKYRRKCHIWTLHDDTKTKAKKEGKTPVIGLFRKASPGVLLVIHSDDLLSIMKELHDAEKTRTEIEKTRISTKTVKKTKYDNKTKKTKIKSNNKFGTEKTNKTSKLRS